MLKNNKDNFNNNVINKKGFKGNLYNTLKLKGKENKMLIHFIIILRTK